MEPDLLVLQEADSGEAAVRLAAELIPDVVLMDLVLPGMSGVEAIRQIKQASPQTQIIALTSYHEDAFIFPALRAERFLMSSRMCILKRWWRWCVRRLEGSRSCILRWPHALSRKCAAHRLDRLRS
jgi:CheY-like chemotaxis protein